MRLFSRMWDPAKTKAPFKNEQGPGYRLFYKNYYRVCEMCKKSMYCHKYDPLPCVNCRKPENESKEVSERIEG